MELLRDRANAVSGGNRGPNNLILLIKENRSMEITTHNMFGRNSALLRKNLIEKFAQFVDLLAREISRYNPIPASSDIIHFLLNVISEILEDGFVTSELGESEYEETPHYWTKLSEVLHSDAIKFVHSLDVFTSENEKAYIWILIELHKKNLPAVFEEISLTRAIISNYCPRSILKKHYSEVKEIIERLCRIEYRIESKFLKTYEDFCNTEPTDYDDVHPRISESPIMRRSSDFISKAKTSEGSRYSAQSNSLEHTCASSNLKFRFDGNTEKVKESSELCKSSLDEAKFESIEETHQTKSVGEIKAQYQETQPDEEDGKCLTPRWKHKKQASLMRSSSFQQLHIQVQESFLHEEHTIISPLQCSSNLSCKSDFYSSPIKDHSTEDKSRLHNSESPLLHEEDIPVDYKRKEKDKPLFILGFAGIKSDLQNNYDTPIFKNEKRHQPSAFSSVALDLSNTCKNSEFLYTETYQKLQNQYKFRDRPTTQIKVEDQGSKCFGCEQNLSKKLLFFWPKQGYCHYTGHWYCMECMAPEEHMIPWYVTENWDFGKYSVCKTAYKELLCLFDKPNVIIDYKTSIVRNNKVLYDTLVIRRQLHLMFDMICDTANVITAIENNANLLLKQNLFSLKNLVDINKGTMLIYLEKCCVVVNKHIISCETCQQKGKICQICSKEPKIFTYDIKNTAICSNCKQLYHSKCFLTKGCCACK